MSPFLHGFVPPRAHFPNDPRQFRPGTPLGCCGGRPRRAEPRAAARSGGGARPRLHPRRRRVRQDDHDHPADRVAGRERRVSGDLDHGGDVHRQGGRRAAGAPRGARRPRRPCQHLPLGRPRQLRHFAPERRRPGSCPRRRSLLRQIANTLPVPFRFRPAGDLATEIEWAKNRRIPPERYLGSLDGREPPIPADLMQRVYREYERRKAGAGSIDFEDLLELAVSLFERDGHARDAFRAQYRAFTVDEYQDVNLLQQQLLELWLGTATTSASSATTTSPSTRSPAPAPSTCSPFPSGSRTRSSSGSRRTTARRRTCSRSRTGSSRGSAAPRRFFAPARGRSGADRAGFRDRRGGGRGDRRDDPRVGRPARGDRDPVPDERAAHRLRGAAPRRAHPVPGVVAPRA